MDIWLSWTKRKAACHYCGQIVAAGTPIVKGKLWKKSDGTARHWTIRFYWHPQCWIAEGMLYLEQHPYSTVKGGKKKLLLSAEDATKRLKLLRSRARFIYELKGLLEDEADGKLEDVLLKLAVLKLDIAKVGGIPKSWAELPF